MRPPQLTAHEVLERLHLARKILGSVLRYSPLGVELCGEPWRSGQDVITALSDLEQYALRRLHRRDVAGYAADVREYAQMVLGELLAAAPAVSDERRG